MSRSYDVVIVGAGPAGLFAANELRSKFDRILIIDRGKDINERYCQMFEGAERCMNCKNCDVLCGVGGAGTFSDGTLNLRPDIGGDLTEFCSHEEAYALVEYVDRTFLAHGMPDEIYCGDAEAVEELKRRAASVGAKFIEIKQRHIGSDKTRSIIEHFKRDLEKDGVQFMLKTCVTDIIVEEPSDVDESSDRCCEDEEHDGAAGGERASHALLCRGVITERGERIESRYTILAPGRVGASWVEHLIKKYDIKSEYAGIDVGVRVEVPAITMDPVTKISRDPKFHIRTDTYEDFARTFCTNERGFVVKEVYDDFIGVNGHSFKNKKSENTNFAFLVRVELTEPVENTTEYGISIAKLATTIGGGKPIIQRMGDLRRGRRSTHERIMRNLVRNTLMDVTPGDISMALPHRIVMDITEGLEKLDRIIPGVAADSTLLYAPEIKFYAMRIKVNSAMETSVKNLFAAGDGAGLSRDIVNASATGILAARGIMRRI